MQNPDAPDTKQAEKFRELVSSIKAAMLVTRKLDGSLKARPMMLVEATDEGILKFITGLDSEKVEDVLVDAHVNVTFQHNGAFLSVTGKAVVDPDREELRRLWSKWNEAWFDGPEDPRAVLLSVVSEQAEYWDNRGIQGLKYALKAMRATVTGNEPKITRRQYGTVGLR